MTAQFSETLILRGEKLSLCTEPLGRYLEIIDSPINFVWESTANWRGYLGTWKIEAERLYLASITGRITVNGALRELGIEDVFPGYPDGVFAHWYTGELRCPRGNLNRYVHQGYASEYQFDIFIAVQKGRVTGERIVMNGNKAAEDGDQDMTEDQTTATYQELTKSAQRSFLRGKN